MRKKSCVLSDTLYTMKMFRLSKYILLALFAYGCAVHGVGVNDAPSSSASPKLETSQPVDDIAIIMPEFSLANDLFNCSSVAEIAPEDERFFDYYNVPASIMPKVNMYLKYFTTGNGRSSMQDWIDRSGKYMYMVTETFRKEGLPLDLVVLGFTESGYNPKAASHAGAVGMWQFMKATGKTYGLDVNSWVDERKDFVKATEAAAAHLNDLHGVFGDWYLALAAYNAGQGRIKRATRTNRTDDFFKLAASRTLNIETRDYVPKFLAQLIIYDNMAEYGFTKPSALPLMFSTITVNEQVNIYQLAEEIGITTAEMRELNPELLTPMTPPVAEYALRVPLGKVVSATDFLAKPDVVPSRYHIYNAKAGDKIEHLAQAYGTTAQMIKEINSLHSNTVYTNTVLFIPNKDIQFAEIDKEFASDMAKVSPRYYTVVKGDNFTKISRKYGMPLNSLVALNPNINPRRIYPGQVIIVSRGGLNG